MLDAMTEFARHHIVGRDIWTEENLPPDVFAAMGQAGLFRIGLPVEFGGTGGGYPAIAAAERALVAACGVPGMGTIFGGHQVVANYYIVGFASPAQRADYLPKLAAGTCTMAVAISEPEVGAHPKLLETTAHKTAVGWRIGGRKAYVTNGPIADIFIVLAITAVEAGRKRYSMFLVPRGAPGLEIHHAPTPAGMRPAGHVSLTLTDCVVGPDAMLGVADTAYEAMALGFRDAEDAVGNAGLIGKLHHILGLLAGPNPAHATDDTAAELGALHGLVAVAAAAVAAIVTACEAGAAASPRAQAITIGMRQLALEIVRRVRTLKREDLPRVDALLASIEGGMNVARGPRRARTIRLGREGLVE